jgi:AcrR family transcriptional regulator
VTSLPTDPHTVTGLEAEGQEPAASRDAGSDVRARLLQEATRIFADKGYARASTREICQAAGANVASIHYYFGDKPNLYRAVLLEPVARITSVWPAEDDPSLPLETAMRRLLGAFLTPMVAGGDMQLLLRIHLREMIEPTPMLRDVIERNVVPHYQGLVQLLSRHCGVDEPDDDLHRLAFAVTAMVNDYCMSREWMEALAPGLLSRPDALERALDSVVGYACALVQYERARRQGGSPHPC